ncbi:MULTISPECIES: hypothetical protein [unclassified Arthrobacter]|uniref:hypothetical protein n=1 Tax=unclassified Arthrobacter TaxID=235627 RepID=UPI0009717C9A|nr:hypothetical protein [Arthrobacter sp. QXT-31]APX01473.1 hypothetical protein BWQ92_06880 [Arthrobacter sp. QXT-31]
MPAPTALAATGNLFDEDPAIAPSGDLTPDGARNVPAGHSVLLWLADLYGGCGFAKDEGEILVKELH